MKPKSKTAAPKVGSSALVLAVDGRRVIFRNVTTYTEDRFDAVYKGYWIMIDRHGEDEDTYDFCIQVKHEEGSFVYDGYWQIPWDECGDPTMEKAIIEALRGSMLLSQN